MAKKKHQGHYCWRCGRYRANEKFSGKGHAHHLCKDCSKEMKQQAREKKGARALQQGAATLPNPAEENGMVDVPSPDGPMESPE